MDAVNDPSVIVQMQNTDAKINQTWSTVKEVAPGIIKAGRNAVKSFQDDMTIR